MKYNVLLILFTLLTSITSQSVYAANKNQDWVKVGEGKIQIGTVESFVDMNDIRHMNADIVSFKFVTNVMPINASHSLTVLINCNRHLYTIVDDTVYSGTFGTGEASDSISHSENFMIIKGSQFENVARLVCAKRI